MKSFVILCPAVREGGCEDIIILFSTFSCRVFLNQVLKYSWANLCHTYSIWLNCRLGVKRSICPDLVGGIIVIIYCVHIVECRIETRERGSAESVESRR